MAAPEGENSNVNTIKQELEEQEEDFKQSGADLGQYKTSIDEALAEAHSAVDGSSQKDVEELFALGEEAKAVLDGVSSTAAGCAQGLSNIRGRL